MNGMCLWIDVYSAQGNQVWRNAFALSGRWFMQTLRYPRRCHWAKSLMPRWGDGPPIAKKRIETNGLRIATHRVVCNLKETG